MALPVFQSIRQEPEGNDVMTMRAVILSATLAGAALTALPAASMPLMVGSSALHGHGGDQDLVVDVQYRHGRPGVVRGGRRPVVVHRYGRSRGDWNRAAGAAAAVGIAGALIGGVLAAQEAEAQYAYPPPPPPYPAPAYGRPPVGSEAWLDYCSRRYRSFDPYSGTFVGYDGRRYPCQ
jgi:hypothetical protein